MKFNVHLLEIEFILKWLIWLVFFLFVLAFGRVYFQESYDKNLAPLKDYKSVLISKGTEDSLVSSWIEN